MSSNISNTTSCMQKGKTKRIMNRIRIHRLVLDAISFSRETKLLEALLSHGTGLSMYCLLPVFVYTVSDSET